ncbi:MAG: hypothetical protein WCD31_01255 [Gillisia sp.]
METSTTQSGKSAAIVAYITLVGTIIAYFMNNETKNPFASFHIRQGLGINITFYVLGALVSIFNSWMVSIAFYVFILILWIYGLVNAIQGVQREVPILGPYFQKWFSTIS